MHPVQQKLLRLIDTYNIGNMSLRDVAKIMGEEHPQVVKHHLEQLERKELIDWDKEKKIIKKRAIAVSTNIDLITIPVLGSANCGYANVYADERIEGHIKVSSTLLKNKFRVFAIKAVGPSMNNANIDGKRIEEGDYVIVDPEDRNIRNNDYVLSVIDEMANIKKIHIDHENNQITLLSESTYHYPPIYIDEAEASRYIMNGKVIQVIKQVKAQDK
jgi:repressor LexA